MPFHIKILRWATYVLGLLFLLIVVYGVGRLIHVAQGGIYHGERAPYLQMAAPDAMTVRWQSTTSYPGVLHYGLAPDRLEGVATEQQSRQAHEIRVDHLKPATRYYYAVGPASGKFTANQDSWFITSPPPGAEQSVRFLVLGDPGLAIPSQSQVWHAALGWLSSHQRPNRPIMDMLLTTGDNAYKSGKNEEFQRNFFTPFQAILRNTPVWPIYGNHDARRWSFFEIFSLPTNGESGGLASGTEHYYSFNYGQVHFVALDSQGSDLSAHGEMANWLRRDLKSNQLPWIISLFHHPPYSKGSHDSDDESDSRGRMLDMRQNILPILEANDADLVLTGHSHMYERSYLIDCQYGLSGTVQPDMILSHDKHNYQKRSVAKGSHEGTLYAVVGSSARADYGPINHPIMARSLLKTGSLVVNVKGRQLEGWFIGGNGEAMDEFSITKGVANAPVGSCNKQAE